MEACRNCYASLFTDRAIDYRQQRGFDHMQVALSVGFLTLGLVLFAVRQRMAPDDGFLALRIRTLLMDEMMAVFRVCDVMVVPANTALPRVLETPELAATDVKPGSTPTAFRGGNTFLGNMTGLPALVLPCGFSAGPPRLPIGLQVYGRAFDEALVLRAGHAYEQATSWHLQKPPV